MDKGVDPEDRLGMLGENAKNVVTNKVKGRFYVKKTGIKMLGDTMNTVVEAMKREKTHKGAEEEIGVRIFIRIFEDI